MEEKELRKAYSVQYNTYQQNVKKVIPFIY
jgi:protein-S-isoprenylcysteine O-methyltransferase Ste14